MRAILIWLLKVLIQAVLLNVTFRLSQKLLARALGTTFWYCQCDVLVTWSTPCRKAAPLQLCLSLQGLRIPLARFLIEPKWWCDSQERKAFPRRLWLESVSIA